ncbi:hypothetical protein A2866_05930 [Candidatus Roizmanbacteria bacterium RIFCSPHIGHO2_01_FULL_39_8]|uniref:Methyltransferase domain-containing protein n=3 Tax=Candidatus Roizmaniibacteriota TaxID=1752723 RepID=A0A1F7GFN6_9BACT|nr:MAG: hypothetical protein A2866_05930 [Candidatus Roizmanbacteria bacterium RIFCSPHIGHO2_01_FULL_39_8]OGK25615.1 MAG: hypothetical protein A3C28_00385 [Candidatus Roizmanbacteria bacterium RIFCSPHIGHO2_02_FULL_39_9]OGK36886.1 MAG: hypothetical protein A3F60_04580 [Candidatus Roizmanbacteria bacterium RIFCSPHIGHO2_12_FULL_39_8]
MHLYKKHTQKTYSIISDLYTSDFEKDYGNFHFIDQFLKLIKLHKLELYPLVDLGTGPGTAINYILNKQHNLSSISGVDFEKKFCDYLKNKYKTFNRIKIIHEDMVDFTSKQKKNSVGSYIACYSIIHLPDHEIDELFMFIQRSLVKKGLFIFSCFRGTKKELEQERYQVIRDLRLHHDEPLMTFMNYFTETELKKRLYNIGFEIIKIEVVNPSSRVEDIPKKQIWVIVEKI